MAACGDMVNAGGIEAGLELLALVSPSCKKARKDGVKLPKLLDIKDVPSAATFALPNDYDIVPDALTFTAALMLCAKQGGWDDLKQPNSYGRTRSSAKVLRWMDNSLTRCCSVVSGPTRKKAFNSVRIWHKSIFCRETISKTANLALDHPNWSWLSSLAMLFLKLACKLRDWDLGFHVSTHRKEMNFVWTFSLL
ncbi:hypothetical protein BC829DRAFT_222252 [Chytridium lagenaria]|nr:hypothetical protein BC829DRAFT_222252 [Chytridium lagenaria]